MLFHWTTSWFFFLSLLSGNGNAGRRTDAFMPSIQSYHRSLVSSSHNQQQQQEEHLTRRSFLVHNKNNDFSMLHHHQYRTRHATRIAATASSSSSSSSSKTTTEKASSSSFDLNQYFKDMLPHIEKALDQSIQSHEKNTQKICESMKYSLMAGGKRIRPILCLAACEMFAGTGNYQTAIPTAVSLEMIHTMSLIHDDLPSMDNDDLRRGKPTNHVVYGEDVAILAGDALLSTSFQHVAEHTKGVDPSRVLDVVIRLGKSVGAVGLAGGQVMDLECEGKSSNEVTLDDLRWIHTHKTATLLQVAVAGGAIMGGANASDVKACEQFALNIGLAFQVADDILDVTQTTEELGKTAGKDEDTDKTTYPKLLGLDGARAEAERLIMEAKKSLEPYGDRAIPLLALADFIIDRKN